MGGHAMKDSEHKFEHSFSDIVEREARSEEGG